MEHLVFDPSLQLISPSNSMLSVHPIDHLLVDAVGITSLLSSSRSRWRRVGRRWLVVVAGIWGQGLVSLAGGLFAIGKLAFGSSTMDGLGEVSMVRGGVG